MKKLLAQRQVRVFLALGLILIFSQGFNAALSISTLHNYQVMSELSVLSVQGEKAVQIIELGLRYGKPLRDFYGGHKILSSIVQTNSTETNIRVFDLDGRILFSLQNHEQKNVSPALMEYALKSGHNPNFLSHDENNFFFQSGVYHLILPVCKNKSIKGYLDVEVSEKLVNKMMHDFVLWNIMMMLAFFILSGSLFFIWINSLIFEKNALKIKNKIFWGVVVIIGGSQLLFSSIILHNFYASYTQKVENKLARAGEMVSRDIQFLLGKNISLDRMAGVQSFMRSTLKMIPEARCLCISDAKGKRLYSVFSSGNNIEDNADASISALSVKKIKIPIYNQKSLEADIHGWVSLGIDSDFIHAQIKTIGLDLGTIMVVCLVFLSELYLFFKLAVDMVVKNKTEKEVANSGSVFGSHSILLRTAGFFFFFGYDMSISFIPLYMEKIYAPFLGLSKEMVLGLPLSAEMFAAFTGILLAGNISDRKGWQAAFIPGAFCSIAGGLVATASSTPLVYILARFCSGLGFGAILLSLQSSVFMDSPKSGWAVGIANVFAGVFAGSIAGNAVGSMLAEHYGYDLVFCVGSLFIFFGLVHTVFFLRGTFGLSTSRSAPRISSKSSGFVFVLSPRVFSTLFFVSLPAAITLVGMLYYFLPIQLKEDGFSQSDIGRMLMLYGLCMIYVNPLINHLIDKSESKERFVFIAGICGGCALVVFSIIDGLWGAGLAIVLIAFSNCFGSAAALIYALTDRSVKKIGESRAVGIFRTVERLGQVAGPMVFALSIGSSVPGKTIAWLGLIYLGLSLVFLLFKDINVWKVKGLQ